jgi:peptidoglycan/LPS O-acetylase OafA/YrhL
VIGRFLHSFYPILIGCLAAFLLHDQAGFERLRRMALWGKGVPALILFLMVHFATPWAEGWLREGIHVLYPLATTALLIPLLTSEGPAARLLRWSPLPFVGRLSYGVYLLHLLALASPTVCSRPGFNIRRSAFWPSSWLPFSASRAPGAFR